MSQKLSPEQSAKVQTLRGIAVIAVVFIHSAPITTEIQIILRPFINFGVGLFLFLSGMLSSIQNYNPKNA